MRGIGTSAADENERSTRRLDRRVFLRLAAGGAGCTALPPLSHPARAQAYPSRPVHIVVGLPAGGGADIVARLAAQELSQRLHQQFIVEDRPGAGSAIATEAVAKAEPDGTTLLLAMTSNPINDALRPNANFNFLRDIAPVAMICAVPFVLLANPGLPAKSVVELVAYAKANPGKINYGSRGTGTVTHVAVELFKIMAGIDLVHVPYRNDFLPGLLAGDVQLGLFAQADTLDYIRSGKLRALAVTSTQRSAELPDVPAMAEVFPGYEAIGWLGVGAPRGTSAAIEETLNAAIAAAVADPTMRTRLAALGFTPMPMSIAAFTKFVATDSERWARVIRTANIKAE
jgi:tripartite-type tricarboxylate transporter receptor subunit TctC